MALPLQLPAFSPHLEVLTQPHPCFHFSFIPSKDHYHTSLPSPHTPPITARASLPSPTARAISSAELMNISRTSHSWKKQKITPGIQEWVCKVLRAVTLCILQRSCTTAALAMLRDWCRHTTPSTQAELFSHYLELSAEMNYILAMEAMSLHARGYGYPTDPCVRLP